MRASLRFIAAVSGLAAAASGCGGDETFPKRDCTQVIWVAPARSDATVELLGSWDGYSALVPVPKSENAGWNRTALALPPGEYGYLVAEDGVLGLHAQNPLSTYRGEDEVSLLVAPDCSIPEVRVTSVEALDSGDVAIAATFFAATEGGALDASSIEATTPDGVTLAATDVAPESGTFRLTATGLPRGRHMVTVSARGETGKSGSARAAAWVRPAQRSFREGLLYHLMIDRFRGDGGAVLPSPETPTSRAGGTLDGVRAEIEKGTFEALGVTALWLSPVYENPVEAREGRDGHPSEGYHGYWVLKSREVEPRIGGREALAAVVRAAHDRGIRVLLDLVPNHLYEDNPVYTSHQGDGWFNDGLSQCVCGDPGCAWADRIQTCWFAPYLPDVRWQSAGSMKTSVDDALFWAKDADVDGFRIDAVPMMPRGATRRILHALRTEAGRRDDTFVMGEVFTGPGQGGVDEIRYHIGPDGLDSAFDFPLMWSLRTALAHSGGFDEVSDVLAASDAAFAGSQTVQARIIGNHDTTRFVSEANGDAGFDPWTTPPAVPTDPAVYAKHRMALGMIYTVGDLPVLYYGDEMGLAGGSDPDSRRVMPDVSSLTPDQAPVYETTTRLGQLRLCSEALRSGTRKTLAATRDTFAMSREASDGSIAIALFSKASSLTSIALPEGSVPAGDYVDAMTGQPATISSGAALAPPLSFQLLFPAGSPCL